MHAWILYLQFNSLLTDDEVSNIKLMNNIIYKCMNTRPIINNYNFKF